MSNQLGLPPVLQRFGTDLGRAATELSRQQRRSFLLRRPMAKVFAAASALAVALAVVLATSLSGGPLSSPSASAAQVLSRAAAAVARQPSPRLGRREFSFVRWRMAFLVPVSRHATGTLPPPTMLAPKARVTIDAWLAWSPTQAGAENTRVVAVSFPTAVARRRWEALGRPSLYAGLSGKTRRTPPLGSVIEILGRRSITVPELLALPDNARRVYERLFAGVPATDALNVAFQCLVFYPLRSGLRSAIYRALALVPGVHAGGEARTLTGRHGEVLWALAGGPPADAVRGELIVNEHSGNVLGTRTVIAGAHSLYGVPAGTIYSQAAEVMRTITHAPAPPSAQAS